VPGVAAPSANRFGRVSPTRASHVVAEFGPGLRVLDGGECAVGIESAIVDCTRLPPAAPALLRPGQLARADLERVLGQALVAPDAQSPRAPGTLASHYAPRAAVRLLGPEAMAQCLAAPPPAHTALYSRQPPPARGWWHRAMPTDADAAAHELFAVLRELDEAGAQAIWIEAPPPGAAWDGVRDRLQRAAA
jgi:L-threonylcarbamoyladenylate synthase